MIKLVILFTQFLEFDMILYRINDRNYQRDGWGYGEKNKK